VGWVARLPEGIYPIAEATLYLATAPKSNSSNDYCKAVQRVEAEGKANVPSICKTAIVTPATWATRQSLVRASRLRLLPVQSP
jgi:replication-associated recombination protein RarA